MDPDHKISNTDIENIELGETGAFFSREIKCLSSST